MKFPDKSLKEEEISTLFDNYKDALAQILLNRPANISYQLTYDTVYRLTKQHQQEPLLALTSASLADWLHHQISHLQLQDKAKVSSLTDLLLQAGEITNRISEVCLFLDINYCQKEKGSSLKKKLNSAVFRVFVEGEGVVQAIVRQVFEDKLGGQMGQDMKLLREIREIDESECFFDKHFLPEFQHLIKDFYLKECDALIHKYTLEQYIRWAIEEIRREKAFLEECFQRKANSLSTEQVIKVIYDQVVTQKKASIYSPENEKDIFNQLTLPLLELLKHGKNGDIEEHI